MKAAIVKAPQSAPVYGDFAEPVARNGFTVVEVKASALTQIAKARASGAHYSSDGQFPVIAGVDGVGVTPEGRRVCFMLPEAPFGALAERALVDIQHCIELPDTLDDVTAAAMANPGMSAWAALVERARLAPAETVLVNGATGAAGRLAVQLARYLGAQKIIATGRNAAALQEVKALGADAVIAFAPDAAQPLNSPQYEQALLQEFAQGVDVVIDYLWGESARILIAAIAKGVRDATPVRFVQVGSISGESIDLPGAGLRSSPIVLMGSGIKSLSRPALLNAVRRTFDVAAPANLRIAAKAVPLAQVERHWNDAGHPRVVFTIGG